MLKRIASIVFLIDSVVIGLGAFGHGSQVPHLHAALDQFPIEPNVQSMLYVVWYFVSGCMLAFGVSLLWVWQRVRKGDGKPLVVAMIIGVLYVGIGAFGLVYRHGDPFMAFFAVLGGLLLASGYAMRPAVR
jgi:CHASE2 domain-containing sensor protein